MGVRRLLALVHGLGYEFKPVQHAPASPTGEAGASAVSDVKNVTSIREFARMIGNPKAFLDG